MSVAPFYDRHRGPFQLMLSRAHPKKAGFSTTEWTQSSTRDGQEAAEEGWALLDDPRDTIEAVYFFSLTEQQFVGAVRKEDNRDRTLGRQGEAGEVDGLQSTSALDADD